MAEGADGVTGEFLTSTWDALGGDRRWLECLAIKGQRAMPSCLPMTDLGTASFAATGPAIAELLSTAEIQDRADEVDRASGYAWLRMGAARQGGIGPSGRDPGERLRVR